MTEAIDPTAVRERLDKPEWLQPPWHDQHQIHVAACASALSEKRELEYLFIGDSITYGWQYAGEKPWQEHFAADGLNLAIGGDSTGHLLWRLSNNPHLEHMKPKHVVCLIGTNNIGNDGQDENDVLAGVQAVVQLVKEKLPDAQLHVLAVFPRGRHPDHPMRVTVNKANPLLKQMAAEEQVFFHDCNAVFLDADHIIPETCMPDELHLSPAGYALLAPALLKAVHG